MWALESQNQSMASLKLDKLNYCIIKELFTCKRQKLDLNGQKQTNKHSNLGKKLIETEGKTSRAKAPSGPVAGVPKPECRRELLGAGQRASSPKLRLLLAPPSPALPQNRPRCQKDEPSSWCFQDSLSNTTCPCLSFSLSHQGACCLSGCRWLQKPNSWPSSSHMSKTKTII